jgi:LmbE family N-acetylglucosaminyl deacetylase/CheY-like chemotaxis protein
MAARLLVVTAHPDDEVLHFGGLIHRTALAGGQVTLVCTTRGEVGEIAAPALATPEILGAVREAELRAVDRLLQVQDLRLLDYRDSGMAGGPDNEDPGAFMRAEADAVVRALVRIMRDVRPMVVATWAPDGGYGHSDHVAASRRTTAAYNLAGQAGAPWNPAALYYAARPAGLGDEARAGMRARSEAAAPPPGLARPPRAALPVGALLSCAATLGRGRAGRPAGAAARPPCHRTTSVTAPGPAAGPEPPATAAGVRRTSASRRGTNACGGPRPRESGRCAIIPWARPGRAARRAMARSRELAVSNKRVLVVDDDPHILELIQIVLEDEGHQVTTLASGDRAVEVVSQAPPDLVLLDIVMRTHHGMEVLAELRKAAPSVPVVLLSGAVSQVANMPEIARALGAHDFIEKPFDAQQLIELVNSLP